MAEADDLRNEKAAAVTDLKEIKQKLEKLDEKDRDKEEWRNLLTSQAALHRQIASLTEQLGQLQGVSSSSGAGGTEPPPDTKWEGMPLYSPWLRDKLGMELPYEQYGLYSTSIGGATYGTRQFNRAYELSKYIETGNREHLLLSRCTEIEAEAARLTIQRFRMRGVGAIVGAPLMWLAWRVASHARVTPSSSNVKSR